MDSYIYTKIFALLREKQYVGGWKIDGGVG